MLPMIKQMLDPSPCRLVTFIYRKLVIRHRKVPYRLIFRFQKIGNGKPVKSIILRIIQQKVIQIVITTIKGFDFIILSQPHNPDQILFNRIRN